MAAEDDVGLGGGQLAPAVGVAGLDLHRVALRAAGHVELAVDRNSSPWWSNGRDGVVGHEHAALAVGDDGVVGPAVPQLPGRRR